MTDTVTEKDRPRRKSPHRSDRLKNEIVARFNAGEAAVDLAREYKVALSSIYTWQNALKADAAETPAAAEPSEHTEILNELGKIRDRLITELGFDVTLLQSFQFLTKKAGI